MHPLFLGGETHIDPYNPVWFGIPRKHGLQPLQKNGFHVPFLKTFAGEYTQKPGAPRKTMINPNKKWLYTAKAREPGRQLYRMVVNVVNPKMSERGSFVEEFPNHWFTEMDAGNTLSRFLDSLFSRRPFTVAIKRANLGPRKSAPAEMDPMLAEYILYIYTHIHIYIGLSYVGDLNIVDNIRWLQLSASKRFRPGNPNPRRTEEPETCRGSHLASWTWKVPRSAAGPEKLSRAFKRMAT